MVAPTGPRLMRTATFIESANTASANALTTSVDISCVAAYAEDVQVRFSYLQAPETGDAYSHYYWGIDDVTISENPVNNDLVCSAIDQWRHLRHLGIPGNTN